MACTMFGKKNNQRGHNLVTKKGEQSFLYATRRPDLIHMLIKLHEGTLTVTELWRVQECLGKFSQRGITNKLRRGGQSYLCATRHPDLMHIPIKLHEDIPNDY